MKVHCIRHESFEGLAYIENWISRRKCALSYTLTHQNQSFPDTIDFDLLIIMGGTASVYDELKYSWLLKEKEFIRNTIDRKIKILGICFGAQILADVLGAKVYPAPSKEIGWFPVQFNAGLSAKMEFLPDEITTFHWHGDTFDIPVGTHHLASSECTPNQGFVKDDQIIALQFHPEINQEGIQRLLTAAGHEIVSDKYTQTEEEIRKFSDHIKSNNTLMEHFLDYLCPHENH